MSTQKVAAWSHAETFVAPSEHVEAATRRGEQLGATPVPDGTGAVSGVGADAHAPVEGVDDEEDYDVDADGVVTEREPSFA